MITMDFTTTACNRIDVIRKTYESFSKNLLGVDFKKCKLYINVDPLPEPSLRQLEDICEMCWEFFGEVETNYPCTPNYTAAYKWLYTHAQTKLIFNLEDDWILPKPIQIDVLTNAFEKNPNLYAASFRAYPHHYISIPTSPQVLHRRFYLPVGKGLDPTINPEIQLRADKIPGIELPNKRSEHGRIIRMAGKGYIWPETGGSHNIVVKDIGREWIEKTTFKRPDSKESFTTWIK